MLINSIPFFNNIPINRNISQTSIFNYSNDVFVKSFKSNNDSSFDNFKIWADKTNFLSKIEKITGDDGKEIGEGFEGVTYAIPNTDNWIVKKYKKTSLIPVKTKEANIQKAEKNLPELNAGECIAIVNIPCGPNYTSRYHILEKQEGHPLGVNGLWADEIDDFNISTHLKTLSLLAYAPAASFDKLIDDINYIHKQGFNIDALNPQNFLFDEKKQTINFVDINDRLDDDGNLFGEVLFSLLDGYFTLNILNNSENTNLKEQTLDLSNIIIDKYFKSMKKKQVKMTDGKLFNQLVRSPLLDKTLGSSDYNEKIEILKNRNLL